MDFLNQAIGQVRDLLLSMTPAARITALLLAGVIAVSLGYLVQQHSASPDGFLFNGEFLPGSDVDRAEAAIAQAGLTGHVRVGNRIRVPRGKKAEYLAAVADGDALPPNFHTILEKALDLSPFTDRETRRQRYKASREQQLSMIIRSMDGIEDAQVIYDIREPRGLSREAQATAAVSIHTTPGESLDPRQAKSIKKAVAAAIAGLSMESVVVTNLSDGSMYGAGGEVTADWFDDPYFQKRINYERLMKSNIEDLLRDIPGLVVQVTAELDLVAERTTRSLESTGEGVARSESTQLDENETSELNGGGRPGLSANGPSRGDGPAPVATVKNKNSSNNTDTESFIPTKDEFTRETGFSPEHVRVAISVPTNYILSVWLEREYPNGEDRDQPLPDDIQLQLGQLRGELANNIQETVVPLLPKELAQSSFSDVVVTFIESLTPEVIAPPSQSDKMLSWAGQNFSTMTMTLVALVSLVMLRSMVKAIPSPEPTSTASALPTLAIDPDTREETSSEPVKAKTTEEKRTKLRLTKGPNLKEDLTDIVREDPDAAAIILRNWINSAG